MNLDNFYLTIAIYCCKDRLGLFLFSHVRAMSTNLDKMDEFENIDLDATRSEMDNDKDKSSLNSSIENLDETSELCASSSEHLNRILDQFTNDYKKYFQLNPTRQVI